MKQDVTAEPSSAIAHQTTASVLLPYTHQLWDWAGVDGLPFAQALFGDAVRKIAPFQSIETTYNNEPCSVLRLCEGNFRLSLPSHISVEGAIAHAKPYRVWVKPNAYMGAIALPEDMGLSQISSIASTKPIYCIDQLALHCAAPAHINGIAVLIWRHLLMQRPIVELHLAANNVEALKQTLSLS